MTKILIVEDESVTALGLSKSIERLGYSVSAVADSGEGALQKVKEQVPDLALMDIMLKGKMDGIEMAEEMRARFDVPVVFLTAYDDEKMLERAKAAGPFGYIVKPFDERTLHSTIEMALHKHEMEKELRRAKKEAEEATELKDKFVSLVAHDLRSPLGNILGYLKLLRDDKDHALCEDHREIIERVVFQGEHLVEMIQELLDVSRIKSGKIRPRLKFHDAHFLITQILETLRYEAEKKGIELVCEIPARTRIHADYDLFCQVIKNLVFNAVKFCKKGDRVTLFVPHGAPSTVAVKDTGAGIEKDRHAALFKYEEHTSTTGTAGERGTGFGLPLSRDIMLAHGGALEFESTPGKGSVFYARLPLVRPVILIADDDAGTRLLLKKLLGEMDVYILEAGNGREALNELAGNKVHLVLADIKMPELDGFELLENIKNNPCIQDIPVIVLTADRGERTRERIFRLGADDFVNKPITREDLVPRIGRYIGTFGN
ncbi:MAG: response regulator [Nitrospinae bacterium]|nr:response regulator [Nitrospinota bacterium]